MRRFNYDDNENFRDEVDKFFGEDSDSSEYKEILEEEKMMQEIQMGFLHRDLNHRTLRAAIRACEKSFFWAFYSHNTRLKMISTTYSQFIQLEDE
jgi:uncharacterized protein YPO0396